MGLLPHRRGVGKGLAGARWLAETGCAGKRLSGLGSSLSRTSGEPVLQGIDLVPLEVVSCRGDAVEAGGEDDCEGKNAVGGVASAVVPDFKGPMSAVAGEETLRRCLCAGERGNPV